MPTGPKGEKRPADVIGNAVKVMRIATGEETEDLAPDDGKDPAAKALGAEGRSRKGEGYDAGTSGGDCPKSGREEVGEIAFLGIEIYGFLGEIHPVWPSKDMST